jgi:hypothetical protein
MSVKKTFQAHVLLSQRIEEEHIAPLICLRGETFNARKEANDLPRRESAKSCKMHFANQHVVFG